MLDSYFFDSARQNPTANALWVDDRFLTYRQLSSSALQVAAALRVLAAERAADAKWRGKTALPRCLLYAHRSESAYAGVLGILAAGLAYVPLNPGFPAERNASIAYRSGATMMIVDNRCAAHLPELLALLDSSVEVILLDALLTQDDADAAHVVRGEIHASTIDDSADFAANLAADAATDPRHAAKRQADDLAYILFTSGTTGVPKGVQITHANASTYIDSQLSLDAPVADARYSQIFDLTFDLSVHDMFVCWANGGCLFVPPGSDPLGLVEFAVTHRLTHWGSVPSTASFIKQFRKLQPGAFPDLRMTMFCGEALPAPLALAWSQAAPNSRILNLYGPTEATISCMRYEVSGEFLASYDGAVVPIGWSLPGEETAIVDEADQPVTTGQKGELLLGGRQLAAGYISDNPGDHKKFFERGFEGRTAQRWYRTGDVVSESDDHGLRFHGRIDTQLKIRGYRIEIQEIEHVVKRYSGAPMVSVIAWPRDAAGMATGTVAFVAGAQFSDARILEDCRRSLPIYGVPNRIVRLETLPVNANGKIDRTALLGLCERNRLTSV